MDKQHAVLCQRWEESESDGSFRPDGYSLHLSDQKRKRYIKDHWDNHPASAPNSYSRPTQIPYWVLVEDDVYNSIKNTDKNGVSFNGKPPVNEKEDILIAEIQCLIEAGHLTTDYCSSYAKERIKGLS